jgi:radical SAM superfamily enzyme YgiQ (UPF0313 family)
MVYKNGPSFKVREVADIKEDLLVAADHYGTKVRTLFFPAGNTIAMKTLDFCEILRFSRSLLPELERITVYGSAQYIHQKGPEDLRRIADAGLSRIHVGLESGDDVILKRIKKGTHSRQLIEAGKWAMAAGIELSLYVILGIGGKERTVSHAEQTANVLNEIDPDFIRLRTLVPKVNTPLLNDVLNGSFKLLTPREILSETASIIKGLQASSYLASDHYTNYINIEGRLPEAKIRMLGELEDALKKDNRSFRPFFIGTE